MSQIAKAAAGAGTALGASLLLAPAADAATFTVANLNDSGDGSLRDAVEDANNLEGADTVVFQSGLSGTITLTTGSIGAYDPVAIQGPGADQLTVDGNGTDRIFQLYAFPEPDQQASISGLTLTDGSALGIGGAVYSGPGVYEAPEVTIADSILTGNYASSQGGAVYLNYGSLTISNSTLSGNRTGLEDSDYGGAIYVADTDGDQDTEVLVRDSTIADNDAYDGAGIYIGSTQGSIVIERTTISGNDAVDNSGGLFVGGGVGPVEVTIDASTFANNSSNSYGGGVGLFSDLASHVIRNSTFSGNSTENGDGGAVNIYADGAEVAIRNSTVTGNSAGAAGGGVSRSIDDDAVSISSSIIAGNTASAGPDLGEAQSALGSFSLGFSLIGNAAGATIAEAPAGSNLLGVDPLLGPLADNGGPMQTHLPAPNSPAADAGIANGLATDQRGEPRTFDASNAANATGGDGTDIGATELRADGTCKGKAATVLFSGKKITGSGGNDVIVGTKAKEQISAKGGKDTVCGGSGNDTVKGGGGKDTLLGEKGKDTLKGGGGKDKLSGGPGKDKLRGGPGKDKLKGGGGKDSEVQ